MTALLRKVVTAQEEQRARIARDLHDELGQQLTALRLTLERYRDRTVKAGGAVDDDLDRAASLAKDIDTELDFLAWELRPAVLDDLGLASALESLATSVARRAGIDVALEVAPGLPPLAADVELAVYRIAQEALTNAVRHSGCTRARVWVSAAHGAVYLRVADDGHGLGGLPRSGGGVRGMRERALMIGGRLLLGVSDEGGVEVELCIPSAAVEA